MQLLQFFNFFFERGAFGGSFYQKGFTPCLKCHFFVKIGPPKAPFLKKIDFLIVASARRHCKLYFKPKFMQVGPKLGPLRDLRVAIIIFSKHKMASFKNKGPPKAPFLKKKSLFDLLDDKVDILSFNLSPKFCMWDRN